MPGSSESSMPKGTTMKKFFLVIDNLMYDFRMKESGAGHDFIHWLAGAVSPAWESIKVPIALRSS